MRSTAAAAAAAAAATALLAAAPAALADTIKITATSDLTFDPSEVTAAKGDVLEFHFEPSNHSVAMGEFGSINGPCVPANEGGFFSGYMPTSGGENEKVFQVTMNSTDPMVFYCTQSNHCAQGMIGVVNADDGQLDGYKTNASAIANAVAPKSVFGGVLTTEADASDDDDSDDGDDGGDSSDSSGDGDQDDEGAAGTVRAATGGVALAAVGAVFAMI
ncbi:hypothetical protein MKZ38_005759 [Zalerion maritima]|uniref:Blue (type 1) copper domain-containing protein n=1 Tax=Zalerion maritima TaxID=339359 RepID=A0AAD5RKK0_9PEZI|nr:hypothetical protein MKZ38_005759 [Zalerion maritima]